MHSQRRIPYSSADQSGVKNKRFNKSVARASYELGYAFKFFRIGLVILIQLFNIWGFVGGSVGIIILLVTNKTVVKDRGYLYPLIPFNGKALMSMYFRTKKKRNE